MKFDYRLRISTMRSGSKDRLVKLFYLSNRYDWQVLVNILNIKYLERV